MAVDFSFSTFTSIFQIESEELEAGYVDDMVDTDDDDDDINIYYGMFRR